MGCAQKKGKEHRLLVPDLCQNKIPERHWEGQEQWKLKRQLFVFVCVNVHRIWRNLNSNASCHDMTVYDSIQRWNQDAPTEKFKVSSPKEWGCNKSRDPVITGRKSTFHIMLSWTSNEERSIKTKLL